ncbi:MULTISPECIES: tRNA glutamyl-Q(34) synthetase GluQRS [unclassified Hyphomicrobium]|uniref:tRNA glutamyl-Q(34) synthetase GluQRS n=1 Tax=unclassified Hyphomicrobium TaxID=2619925 RepID=UPI000213F029|nr:MULTISPECIES: tRNA glutamyl-Q(34) synthetase GluQRS [unclassified Hyphomicrobium]CCB67924.1 putative glutamyl-tRNA synthetase [Hyphomicrobium sp. MC1]
MASVTRFAPSPNGLLHVGHALSAIIAHDTARRNGGRFLLRIEDIDLERRRPEFVTAIFEDLNWLGLTWEEPVLVQSEHFSEYLAAADRLIAMGLLYPCFATRKEIVVAADPTKTDPDGVPLYPGIWRGASAEIVGERMAAGETPALRLNMEGALQVLKSKRGDEPLTFVEVEDDGSQRTVVADPARWGDAVIVRKEVPASYHLSVVVDDARQGVTHVTRGQDLLAATDLQRLLQELLDLPQPVYSHHRVIRWANGQKLSKSNQDMGLRVLRDEGATADDIRRVIFEV